MNLYTLIVTIDGKASYVTQVLASSPRSSVAALLKGGSLKSFSAETSAWTSCLSTKNLCAFAAFEGLKNAHFATLAYDGNYVEVKIVRTVQRMSIA